MSVVKKVDPEWFPSEAPELKVGEEVEVGDAEQLLNEGKVELVGGSKKEVVEEAPVEEATSGDVEGEDSEPAEEELVENQCPECKFIAKNSVGLNSHKRSHD